MAWHGGLVCTVAHVPRIAIAVFCVDCLQHFFLLVDAVAPADSAHISRILRIMYSWFILSPVRTVLYCCGCHRKVFFVQNSFRCSVEDIQGERFSPRLFCFYEFSWVPNLEIIFSRWFLSIFHTSIDTVFGYEETIVPSFIQKVSSEKFRDGVG